jgi:hypothetical protein
MFFKIHNGLPPIAISFSPSSSLSSLQVLHQPLQNLKTFDPYTFDYYFLF